MDLELNQRAIRQFLNLRLIDVERACGISATRISQAERGVLELRPAEQRIITNFLREKLVAFMEKERDG